ncbi:xanthine phosphoribosyltransferase 1 [Micractinium conductrix]|uniref:Xanthine phosphoribosyltransferase 1 n=1 Tax=Micractinium conductrix TaxID=554055 RepID=A0A2P6V1F2_9CHLO|nr:xanthine phosphoribosyltransferase 1 [Micractinium conductrix]|eukprot:PSC67918.1 xanthine phosphoribosyltransferase 1 [Micractinium conductrix]
MGICIEPAESAVASVSLNACCTEPAAPAACAPARMHVTYDELHGSIVSSLDALRAAGWGEPDYLVAISGGGLIPARILRSVLRHASKQGGCAQIKVIGLELYSDELEGRPHEAGVKRTQWFEKDSVSLVGKRILVVDEVDDSRATLAYAVRELQADVVEEEAALAAVGAPVPETHLGVYVIHNKLRPKVGSLPEGVPEFVAQELDCNPWICYPWDAPDIDEHNRGAARALLLQHAIPCLPPAN